MSMSEDTIASVQMDGTVTCGNGHNALAPLAWSNCSSHQKRREDENRLEQHRVLLDCCRREEKPKEKIKKVVFANTESRAGWFHAAGWHTPIFSIMLYCVLPKAVLISGVITNSVVR